MSFLPKTKLEFAKFIVGKVASYGTGIIVARVISNNVIPGELSIPKKIAVVVAGAVIASMVQGKITECVDNTIDDLIEGYQEVLRMNKKEA